MSAPSPAVVLRDLSFTWPDGTVALDAVSGAFGRGRTGLVGANGAGKSTLLRLVTGELTPTSGSVTVTGLVDRLPQRLTVTPRATLADLLGVRAVRDALRAIERGSTDPAHFDAVGADWDVEERAVAELAALDLPQDLDRPVTAVSGGEAVLAAVAGVRLRRADVALLDEPTNNLDADARRRLHAALDDYPGTLLVVSHDRVLLDRMERIAELYRGEMLFYGGNFTTYQRQLAADQQSARNDVRHAEQSLRREKRERQQARERAARRSGTAARTVKDAGLPRIVAGAMKRRAQESAGRTDEVRAARIAAGRARLEEAEKRLRDDDAMVLDLPDTTVPAGRTVFAGSGLTVGNVLRGIDLTVRGPERIALTGANGVGKTTLLRVIGGRLAPDAGTVTRADGRIAYLSQRLDLLDPGQTVLDNLAEFAPTLSVTGHRHLLARFLFDDKRIALPIRALSGGERLRATLACVLHAEPAPQLLLLDEPTNNLDLTSIAQLESALIAYRGAFIVVSHDDRFVAAIGVNRRLRLSDGKLS